MSESQVSVLLSIFDHGQAVVDLLAAGRLTLSHLAPVAKYPLGRQDELLLDAAARGLTSRQLKREVAAQPKKKPAPKTRVLKSGRSTLTIDAQASYAQAKADLAEFAGQLNDRYKAVEKQSLPVGQVLAD